MNANINKYNDIITGKAANAAELNKQVAALNNIFIHCEPSEEELAPYIAKVEAAAIQVTEARRAARVAELLEMNRDDMWLEFINHRNFKGVAVKFDRKDKVYKVVENDRPRLSYQNINGAFIAAEVKRLEAAGEVFDPDTLTIANDNKFNTMCGAFFRSCYLMAIDHNLGKAATGGKSYETMHKGKPCNAAAPSINQLVKDLNELVGYLLPETLTVNLHMVKADVRAIGLASVRARAEEFKEAGKGNCLNWLLNAVKVRMNNGKYTVEVEPDKTTVSVNKTESADTVKAAKNSAKTASKTTTPTAKEAAANKARRDANKATA